MNTVRYVRPVLAAALLLFSVIAWSQANVDESLETATLYVDAVKGSDSNPGTQQKPLKTISKAADMAATNNDGSIGTKVIVNPGTYRESVTIGTDRNTTSLPITFEAVTNGTAIVSGGDVLTGWKVYSGNNQLYTATCAYTWGLCALDSSGILQQDIIRRQEMLVVNGKVMTQVLGLT